MNHTRHFTGLRLWWWHHLWRLMNARVVLWLETSFKTLAYILACAVFLAPLLTLGVLGVAKENVPGEDGKPQVVVPEAFEPLDDSLKWQVLTAAGLALALLVLAAHRRRNRLLVCAFKTYPEKEKAAKGAEPVDEEPISGTGLASCIQNELARLLDLFRTIDEASISGTGEVAQVTPTVLGAEQESTFLEGTVSPEVKLKAGLLEIPVGFLVSTFERLLPAPRLTGSLHKENGHLVLTAMLRGSGYLRNWQVKSSEIADDLSGGPGTIQKMVQNLVYRMVADLLPALGSPRWQAVQYYSEGLRRIRPTLRTHVEKEQNLLKAEACFRSALREDETFARCYFNLGYVFMQRSTDACPDAAVTAFRQALKEKPGDVRSCYAVAQICYENGKYDDAIWLSRHALHLDPHHAAARNLLALAYTRRDEKQKRPEEETALPEKIPQAVMNDFEIAAADSWRALCKAQWRKRNLLESGDIVRLCEMNFGITCSLKDRHRASEAAFRRALRVRPNDHEICFEQGKARWRAEKWTQAYESLDRVLEEGLDLEDQAALWLYLMSIHSHLYTEAEDEVEKRLHSPEVPDCYRLANDTAALLALSGDFARNLDRLREVADEVCPDETDEEGAEYISRYLGNLDFLQILAGRTAPVLARDLQAFEEEECSLGQKEYGSKSDWAWKRSQAALKLAFLEAEAFLNPEPEKYQPVDLEDVLGRLDQVREDIENCRLSSRFEALLQLTFARVCLAGARQQLYNGRLDPDLLEEAWSAAQRAVALGREGSEGLELLNEIAAELGGSGTAGARSQLQKPEWERERPQAA